LCQPSNEKRSIASGRGNEAMTIKQFFADVWLCFAVLGAIVGGLVPFYLLFELIVWLLK
jgi:hypothetical protein